MSLPPQLHTHFTYQAQTDSGQRMSGVVEAPGTDAAVAYLEALRLRVISIEPLNRDPNRVSAADTGGNGDTAAAATAAAGTARPLRGEDFVAFNQQLAHLTKAGLPVERGLRLIAADMRRGKLARTVNQVAEELERGTPLPEAFDKHRDKFPPLYGRLVEAGVKTGNLSGVLLNLGQHLHLVQRLRGALWRAVTYPAAVFVGLLLVLTFLGVTVVPQFETLYEEMFADAKPRFDWRSQTYEPKPTIPPVTLALFAASRAAPAVMVALLALVAGVPLAWAALRAAGRGGWLVDRLVLPLPLVGPVLRNNLAARWCDAVRLGVSAGLDLPAAIRLAGDATDSPRLRREGEALVALLEAGQPLAAATAARRRVLPATVPAAIELASGHHDLPHTLQTLAEMFQRQAEARLAAIPAVLTPMLLILISVVIGFVIAGLLLPMTTLLRNLGA